MHSIPITKSPQTGDIVTSFQRNSLTGQRLSEWAEALLMTGHDSEAITTALACPDMHWQQVQSLFTTICRDIGLSSDINSDVAEVRREAMLEEYRQGYRSGASLLFDLNDFREQIRYPEMIVCRLCEDNPDGTNDSGYVGMDSKLSGDALEKSIRQHLAAAGIYRID